MTDATKLKLIRTDKMLELHNARSMVVWEIDRDGLKIPFLLAKMPRTGFFLANRDGSPTGLNGVSGCTPLQGARTLLTQHASLPA